MTPFNLRSLLLAAIFLSNCISWTASRHHYTHNVNGHRSRHRRQGAGLFLSASYVLPGGEGSGWGEWGEVSPCSRTCGGGVASQKRICLQIGPDGQPLCTGGHTKYFSCQTQDCPAGSKDFRAEQCSEFDDQLFRDIKYKWVPYTKTPNPCELNCMPHAERFYYRHKAKVTDGTRCNDEFFDVCVNGTCQPVGCDMMLGSSAKEDKCRECRGNNANCHTTSGVLDTVDLRKGYNDMLLIPEGATSIVIAEVRPSSNYLALRAKNGTFYLNGDYHIDFPRNLHIAGAMWTYERSQQGFAAPDKLRCLGPTNEPIYLSLLLQDENVGIDYEYSLPSDLAPPQNKRYNWVHEEFTPCSASCGGGVQTRTVSCRSREELEVVDETLCDEGLRPPTSQICNVQACDPQWVPGAWGQCSKRCGKGGTSSREITCQKIISNGYPSIVAEKECFDLLGPKPELFQKCNENATCPTWFTGPWKPCNKRCDEGKQSRQVLCYQKNGRKIEVLEDEACEETRPEQHQSCMVQPCDGVDWVASEWMGCDSCQSKIRTRTVVCATKNHVVVDDKFCSYHHTLSTQEDCTDSELPPCQVQWYATQWSNCSAVCGKGLQTRRVFCGQFDGSSVTKVDDSKCSDQPKYKESKPCEVPEDQCPMQWFSAPWSACSTTCGGGSRTRRVMCLRGEEMASECPGTAPLPYETCNTEPCSAAPPPEELEECEEEEPFQEVGLDDEGFTLVNTMFSDSSSEGSGFWTPAYELESNFTDTDTTFEGSGSTSTDTTFIDGSTTDTETEETGSGSTTETLTDDTEISDESTESTEATELSSEITKLSSDTSTDSSPSSSDSSTTISTLSDNSDISDSTADTTASDTVRPTYPLYDDTSLTDDDITDGTTMAETGTTDSGSTETTETTESGPTETTESGSTETTETSASGSTETTETTESGPTETTESGSTESTETTESGPTETTETTESGPTETTETTESGPTETTESGSTETAETTESGSTETTETTESGPTETTETTESGPTETSETTEFGSTKATDTSESGPTETTETAESGPTETTETTESGPTETTETTESGPTETTETTESGPTETTESGPTETTESGATESTETTESGATETTETTESGSTETTESGSTESTETTESGATESTETTESGATDTTESGPTETTEPTSTLLYDSESTSESTDKSTTEDDGFTSSAVEWYTSKTPKMCRPRLLCNDTEFGCCPDMKTTAGGPFDEGCDKPIETCKQTPFGCCPDGVSPAPSADFKDCPVPDCSETLFGCCSSDNKTAAEGNDQEGCPPPLPPCESSKFGCCKDGETEATGPAKQGCPETTVPETESPISTTPVYEGCKDSEFGCCYDNTTEATGPDQQGCPCNTTEFRCCPDGVSPAQGPELEGCLKSCNSSAYGCCPDGKTPAHGPNHEGCCLRNAFGCCPDNYNFAQGPHFEGCGCQYSPYGCCPDNVTSATGYGNKGCGCSYSQHGCCPDAHTEASGPEFEGCACHTYQFGCCPDGVTIARGPDGQGCHCLQSKFKCCGDGETHATGPNHEGCDCSSSKYGCCPDGQTEATGSKFQGCTDAPENKQAACGLAFARGPCRNYSVYWYFDTEYGGCSRFWYGGCEGNGNRFATKEECDDVCVSPPPKDACKLPQSKGACFSYDMRWYYDSQRESCINFAYGGCLGNNNNFETRELCEKQCEPEKSTEQCGLPIEQGSCAGNYPRWGFNKDSRTCEHFVWGGCEGNSNRFSTEAACNLQCNPPGQPILECSQPQVKGTCEDTEAVWSFSQSENRCVPFYFSGCGGNGNRFTNKDDCERSCPSAYVPDKCTVPYETGECANYSEKWYFDTKDQRCRQFYYGGCGGNENRFTSEQLCQNECQPIPTTTAAAPTVPPPTVATQQQARPQPTSREDFCFFELDVGPCTEFRTSWGYDYKTGRCTTFQYGGCGGNRNNFPEEHYCTYYCRATQDICQLPMLQGPCDGSQMRWFYDTSTDSCSQFTYGGCEGNDNRFESRGECERRCKTGPATEQTTAPATVNTRPQDVIPQMCLISSTLEACSPEKAGEYWFLSVATHECLPHENLAEGDGCRSTGVFSSQEGCERSCGAFRGIDVCAYPLDAGICNSFESKYFFNGTSGQCEEFAYGGCMGGPNRFSTEQECINICKPTVDPCTQRPEPGNCVAKYEMWFYNQADDQCSQFIYSGCGGNDNRFETQGSCEGRCKHQPGEVAITTTTTPAPAQPFEPECVTPASLEPCGANETAFYYDAETSTCRVSGFGGCRHPNRYDTEEACERRCGAFRGLDVCRTQVDPGPCRAAFPKYYFDAATGACQEFAYGGCQGGPNRFSTLNECEDLCKEVGPDTEAQAALCDKYSEECQYMDSRCEYGIKITVAEEGCERCSCEERPNCDREQQECNALRCSYGVERIPNGSCQRCKCAEDPCSTANCSANERCVASALRDPASVAVQYSARCVPVEPEAPQTNSEPNPELTATKGGNATLRCIFHGHPPPQITWNFGQITIDSDHGRYRLLADGALEIVALVHADSGVYVCVASNQLGTAQQEIRLVINDEATLCNTYSDECQDLQSRCEHGVKITMAEEGCQRCSCQPTSCDRQRQECDALRCPYGVERITGGDGCVSCKCVEDPCSRANCTANERCVASAYRDPATQAVKYSAHCVPDTDTNEVLPECEQYEDLCAQLSCPYGVQKTMTSRGCVQCACVQEEVNCEPLQQECDSLKCTYGAERSRGEDGCERCKCLQHPCVNKQCAENERCVLTQYRDAISLEPRYLADCRSVEKAGVCPADMSRSTESACRTECRDDADCRGVGKCCARGCSQLCLPPDEPTPATTPPTTTLAPLTQHVTTYSPDTPRAPQASAETQPELTASEGGKATLRCIFHGYPPPQISWNFGQITIDSDHGRYRLLADGALEIVALVHDDSGVYVCVANNQLGTAQQEIRLVVSDPVSGPANIAGDADAVVVGELGRPLQVRCRAYGSPAPAIYWYRGINGPMVPYSNTLYEARDQVLTIRSLASDTLGEYACYAYNGKGKPATWVVTVRGYQPDDNAIGPYYVARDRIVTVTPPERTTHSTTTTFLPDIQAPPFIVPVNTELLPASTTISAGTELSLPCNVDGNPEPRVTWSKDGVTLAPTDTMWITGTRLTIPRATIRDSGVYGCHASNEYSSHSSTVQITVQEIVIPSKCTDSAYFANCALIVQGKFCRHTYYSKFCCKSCVEAGQLDPNDIDMQSDEPYRRKK